MDLTRDSRDGESAHGPLSGQHADETYGFISTERIGEMLQAIAEIGRDPQGGISRLGFTIEERCAHELVADWLKDAGCVVYQDEVGNTIGELPGTDPDLGALGMGSHLDSVPQGGRFDGVAGVVAAVEVLRSFAISERRTKHPLRVVAFAAEEGARFGAPCIGSKVAMGRLGSADLAALRDPEGITAADALSALGFDASRVRNAQWSRRDWAAFVELHVEQSNVLEGKQVDIGIVDMVSGSTRVSLILEGQPQHTGGTPMGQRADALACASEIVLYVEKLANSRHYRGARATVGRLEVAPNSITTIAGRVEMVLDFRDVDSDRQRRGVEEILRRAFSICQERGIELTYGVVSDSSPVALPMWLRKQISDTCDDMGIGYRVMSSGASHDTQIVNSLVPSALVFVPSRAGLSHVPEEWTSPSWIAQGAYLIGEALVGLDVFLQGQGG